MTRITSAAALTSSTGTALTSQAVTATGVNDLWVLWIVTKSASITVSTVTSSLATWHLAAGPWLDGTGTANEHIYYGVMSGSGADTINFTYSGSITGIGVDIDVHPFHSTLAVPQWALDAIGDSSNGSSTTVQFPFLTPKIDTSSGELYWGHARVPSTASGPSSGFTANNDANGNPEIYNTAVTASASPTMTQAAGTSNTIAALFSDNAPTIVRGQKSTLASVGSGTSETTSWGTNPTAGNTVLVFVQTNGTITSVVDNGAVQSTFVQDAHMSSVTPNIYVYRANGITNPASGAYAVTVTTSTATTISVCGIEYSNVAPGPPAATNSGTATGTAVSTGAAAGALIFGGFSDTTSLNPETITYTGPGTQQFVNTNGSGLWAMACADLVASSGSFTHTWTLGDSVTWTGLIAAYNPAPAAVPSMPQRPKLRYTGPQARRRPAQPLSTAAPAATPVSLTDSGVGADSVTIAEQLTDAGTAADNVAIATTLTDTGAGSDSIAEGLSLADAGTGTDSVSPAVTLADSGSAADTTTIGILLTDAGTAADTATVTATVPISDAGTATDTVVIGTASADAGTGSDTVLITVPLTDTGSATDALNNATSLVDAGAGSDTASVGITLPDSGTGSDALIASVAVALPDSGAGSDAVAVNVLLADSGAGSDTVAVTAAVPLSDSGTGTDTPVIGVAFPDSGSAADSLAVSSPIALADSGAGSDSVAVALTLADTAAGADSTAVAITVADSGAGADALAPNVQMPDAGAASDALVVTSVQLSDGGSGADALAPAVTVADAGIGADIVALAVVLADTGAAADTVVLAVAVVDSGAAADRLAPAVSLADSGSGSDALTVPFETVLLNDSGSGADTIVIAFHVADAGTAADSLSIPPPGSTGTAAWRAGALPGRWQTEAQRQRWQGEPVAGRWTIRMIQRWAAEPAMPRWRAVLMAGFTSIAAISLQEINVLWTSDLAGTVIDPTVQPLVVQMAFPVSSGNVNAPAQPVTWYAASWLAGTTIKGYVAQCLVGPGGVVTLAAGQSYDVWSQIQGSPEIPKVFAGVQQVY